MEQVLEGGGLRIVFHRRGDRYGHTIEAIADGRVRAVLKSIEGDAAEPWPASPPFQQLHFEERPGGKRVALLVGMAGTSHWSASVEFDPLEGVAVFDVACRMRAKPEWLGSQYASHEPDEWVRVLLGDPWRAADAVGVRALTADDEFPCTMRWKYVVRPPSRRP
jgi:hypothetical protein